MKMRFHKAIAVNEPEARYIIDHKTSSLNECVVIEHFGEWFDVRRMTEEEVRVFLEDLNRARGDEVTAGLNTPH